MKPHLERKTLIFIIRIWQEYMINNDPSLRGEIEDIGKQQKHYFINFDELKNILTEISHATNKPTE